MAEWLVDRPNSDRTGFLAGIWDPANGNIWPSDFNLRLRWSALLFDYIIVPDVYFCCYGPLYYRLRNVDLLAAPDAMTDPIPMLLHAGVIVPGIADSETRPGIYGTWPSPVRGDHLDLHLHLTRDDGEMFLRCLSYLTKHCARRFGHDPKNILPSGSSPSRFPEIVDSIITGADGFLDAYCAQTLPTIPGVTRDRIIVVNEICMKLRECVAYKGHFLRRRDLEKAIFDCIAHRFPSLQMRHLYDLHDNSRYGKRDPPLAKAVRDILAGIGTIYQVRESWRWNTVGGLLRDYSPTLVAAMHDTTAIPPSGPAITRTINWLHGQYDISHLPFERILEFRRSGLFQTYLKELVRVTLPEEGNAFCITNREFMNFLMVDYLPAIMRLTDSYRIKIRTDHVTKVMESMIIGAGMTGGVAAGKTIAPVVNSFVQSWDLPGIGYVLSIGGIALTWILSRSVSLSAGATIKKGVGSFLARCSKRKWDQSVTKSDYLWRR